MNRYNALPMVVKRFRRPNTSSHGLQDLPKKAPPVEKMCYFVVFKYLACDGYQNGHGRGIPKTNCTDPLCKPKIESVPGLCPECIAVSMRGDSSIESKRKARKRRQAYNKLSGNTETAPVPKRGPRVKYNEATRRNLRAQEMDAQRADTRPVPPKRTNTSSTRKSRDSSSSGSGFGGYENCGRVRRPFQSYGGYSYKEFVVSEMNPRELVHESEEEIDRRWSPKPAAGGFRALFKRL
ncbi:uncharacterized protein DFL_007600 [Arthrobotrys flagrans]|uniref:Uncharacterized protein n=1 Tax=Arthrobotrys flagrans TaxID=97331 RepID=A0A436ZW54_ARTFL|nr:hypothetical protein DFL_007600 [Arthrobotrys flagrans]